MKYELKPVEPYRDALRTFQNVMKKDPVRGLFLTRYVLYAAHSAQLTRAVAASIISRLRGHLPWRLKP